MDGINFFIRAQGSKFWGKWGSGIKITARKEGSTGPGYTMLTLTALRRLVITEEEKARVFEECHSAPFSGHAGRDNTLRKIKERFYWPDYYKDTIEMVTV